MTVKRPPAEVIVTDEQDDEPVDALRLARLAREVLGAQGVDEDVELSLLFVDEPSMADLNRRFRGMEGATDVLSFPIDDEALPSGRWPDTGGSGPKRESGQQVTDVPMLLGDVVICPVVAARNAPNHAGTYEDEMALLVVHGILHLLGMDHEDDDEAAIMEQRERELLARFHTSS